MPGSNDQVDLTISVVEKPTGNLSIGAGYSQADKLSFIGSIKQENVFGSGNYLGLDLNTSKYNRQFVLSTTNPYFTARRYFANPGRLLQDDATLRCPGW